MAKFQISNFEIKNWELGKYEQVLFQVKQAEMKEGPNGDYINLMVVAQDEEFKGLPAWKILSSSAGAAESTGRALMNLGLTQKDIVEGFQVEDLVDRFFRANVEVVEDEYEGETRIKANVGWIKPATQEDLESLL